MLNASAGGIELEVLLGAEHLGNHWSHTGLAVAQEVLYYGDSSGKNLLARNLLTAEVSSRPMPTMEIHDIAIAEGVTGLTAWVADPGLKAEPSRNYEYDLTAGSVWSISLSNGEIGVLHQPKIQAYVGQAWRPTSISLNRRRDPTSIWVADGYGQSLVHRFSLTGDLELTIDGSESGLPLNSPHGVLVDNRHSPNQLVISDRGNHRVLSYDLHGALQAVICHPLISEPSGLAIRGQDLLVTELGGSVLAIDVKNQTRSFVDASGRNKQPGWPNALDSAGLLKRPRFERGRLNSAHGIAVDDAGDVYINEWVIGGRQIVARPI